MLLGLLFAVLICLAGYCGVRLLGLSKGLNGLALAPATGLGVVAILTTWAARMGVFVPGGAVLLVGVACLGGVFLARERRHIQAALTSEPRLRVTLGLLTAAALVPVVVLGIGLYGLQAPLSTHDGAWHVETIDSLRSGIAWSGWYPPGLHASMAALLLLLPWVDSATGAAGAALGLSVLVPLATFGLGCALLRSPLAAAAGALLVSLTFQFPYFPQVWSGWPLAAGTMLATGLWVVALEYVARPSARWAVLGGLLAAGILLTHGTEVYTSAIGLLVIVLASWRNLQFKRLAPDLGIAIACALVLSAPYVPTLLGWANAGGAVGAALEDTVVGPTRAAPDLGGQLVTTLSGGLLFDLPIRLGLLAIGVWCVFTARSGRLAVSLALAFFGLAILFSYSDNALVQRVYSLTYPWGYQYRLLMVDAILASLIGGVGLIRVSRWLGKAHGAAQRGWRRTAFRAVLVTSGFAAAASVIGMTLLMASVRSAYDTVTAGDPAAMSWLRDNAPSGAVLVNDGYADAAIWAPYKAGVRILSPRSFSWAPADAEIAVRTNLAELESVSTAQQAACDLGIKYLYRGASGTKWEARHLPSAAELQTWPGLREVFSSEGASIFELNVNCPR